jgi:hypothetical protein
VRIVIDPSRGPTEEAVHLEDPDDFTAFSVALTGPPRPEALAEVLRHTALGHLDEAGTHVVVDPAGLRALAGPAADTTWDEGLDAMVAYAAQKGWLRDDGVVAHIETDAVRP